MFIHNPYYQGYPYAAPEPQQLWPPDQRMIKAQSLNPVAVQRDERPVEHLTWFHPPDEEPPWRHPYIPPESPPSLPEWRRKWLELPDRKPLETNASMIEKLPEDLRGAHNSIKAPFATPAWQKLVNWRQRESARRSFASHDDTIIGHYINWAERYCQDMVNAKRLREIEMERKRRQRSEGDVVLWDMDKILRKRSNP